MTSQNPFTLRIFVASGDPEGLRFVDRSNWVGRALIFPRSIFHEIKKMPEFDLTGVYILVGDDPLGQGEAIYVGEGDPVRPRLESHHAKKDFWSKALFFVSTQGQLNKAHVQYLESRLLSIAKDAKRASLDNGNSPTEPSLSWSDKAEMDVFLENMLGMMPAIGVTAFERAAVVQSSQQRILSIKVKGVEGSAHLASQGFVVHKGSRAVADTTPSFPIHVPGYANTRKELIDKGILVMDGVSYVFASDHVFSSPSEGAAVIAGNSMNGRTSWRDSSGKTLKQIQSEEAGQALL